MFRKHLKPGVEVRLTPGMSIKVGAVTYRKGTIASRDGEDYLIKMVIAGAPVKVHRYLCEIEAAFINGEWVNA